MQRLHVPTGVIKVSLNLRSITEVTVGGVQLKAKIKEQEVKKTSTVDYNGCKIDANWSFTSRPRLVFHETFLL